MSDRGLGRETEESRKADGSITGFCPHQAKDTVYLFLFAIFQLVSVLRKPTHFEFQIYGGWGHYLMIYALF